MQGELRAMKIIVWGCRGSLPVSGRDSLKYGGNTTCVEMRLKDGTIIVLDAGTGIRRLGQKLIKDENLNEIYLLLTHSHWDHLMGFPFFLPAYSKRFTIHVRGGPIAKESVRRYLSHQMEPPYFPARLSAMKAEFSFTNGIPLVKRIGSAEIHPIPLSHPNGGYGFKIVEEDKSFVFLPDNELDFPHEGSRKKSDYITFCREADLLFHDAQYTPSEYQKAQGWGHSSFTAAMNLAMSARVKRFGLFHHDVDHSDATIEKIVRVCRMMALKKGISVDCFGASEGREILL
jgi:phosphoribosyl 1,2-cyclic phosphodiesterase